MVTDITEGIDAAAQWLTAQRSTWRPELTSAARGASPSPLHRA
jgi:hypothetical protein